MDYSPLTPEHCRVTRRLQHVVALEQHRCHRHPLPPSPSPPQPPPPYPLTSLLRRRVVEAQQASFVESERRQLLRTVAVELEEVPSLPPTSLCNTPNQFYRASVRGALLARAS